MLTIAFTEEKTGGLSEANRSEGRYDRGSAMTQESLRFMDIVHTFAASAHMLREERVYMVPSGPCTEHERVLSRQRLSQ